MKYLAQTTSKPNNEEGRQNQDAIQVALKRVDNIQYFALSDGAGAYGAFNSEWSQLLVDKCPSKPMKSIAEIDVWITEIYQDFYNNAQRQLLQKEYLINKFNKEGSAATLVACWVEEFEEQIEIHILSYGDSFFALNFNENWHFPDKRKSIEMYAQDPYLLNWNIENTLEAGFCFNTFTVAKNIKFELFVSSDAIGQLLLSMYQKQFDTAKITKLLNNQLSYNLVLKSVLNSALDLSELLKSYSINLNTQEDFIGYCNQLFQENLLESDDYSLAYLSNGIEDL
jgi:hypothetical protein